MTGSAIIGTPPANERDALIARGLYVQNTIPIPTKFPLWRGLAVVDPNKPGLPHDSNGPAMIPANAIGIALIAIITSFRLFSRWRSQTSRLGWDDFFIAWAALAGIAWITLELNMILHGNLGKHAWDSTYERQYNTQRFGHACQYLFVVWACLSKISIACFNWRLTGRSSIRWKWVHIACLVVATLWGTSCLIVLLVQCLPVLAANSLIVAGRTNNFHCPVNIVKESKTFGNAVLGSHVAIDLILLAIPITIVWRLQIHKTQKLQAIVPLSFGALGCTAAILRFYYQTHFKAEDLLYNFKDQNDWGVIDTVVTICVTSLPACWGLVTRKFKTISSAVRSKHTTTTDDSRSRTLRPSTPSHHAKSKGLDSTTITGLTEHHSTSSISSHTLGDIEAQHGLAEKENGSGTVGEHNTRHESVNDNEIFSGYGIAMGHPNLRDDYEKRASQRST